MVRCVMASATLLWNLQWLATTLPLKWPRVPLVVAPTRDLRESTEKKRQKRMEEMPEKIHLRGTLAPIGMGVPVL